MALQTPVITISSVTVPLMDLYTITFLMAVEDNDGSFGGIVTNYSINVRPGDDVNEKVSPVIKAFQKTIDDYKASVTIQSSPAAADAIATIESGVSV